MPNTKWNVTKCLHGWNYDRSANKRAGYGNNDTHWLIVYNTCPQVQDATTHPQRHVCHKYSQVRVCEHIGD